MSLYPIIITLISILKALADKELHGANPFADNPYYTTAHNIRVRKEVPMAAQLENRIW